MLSVDRESLRAGLERAQDVFRLHHLSEFAEAEAMASAVLANFGLDEQHRPLLGEGLAKLLPATGNPLLEGLMTSSMGAGVLVGLLIADATLPGSGGAVPDCPPADL